MASLNMAGLPAKLNGYAMANNKQILSRILLSDLGFLKYFGQVLNTNDEVPLTELVMGDILQPGGKDTFNPTNNAVNFKARIGKVRPCKSDLSFTPSQIQSWWKSYIGLIDGGKITTAEVPFQAFVILKVIEKVKENLHLKAVFKGVLNSAGTTPGDTMTGLIKIIGDIVLAGNIGGTVVTAAITDANAGDMFKKVLDLVDDTYYETPMVCVASPKSIRSYYNWYQTQHGSLPYNNEFKKAFLDGTQIELISEPGLSGTNHIFITPKENLFWLVSNESDLENVAVEKEKRNIHMMIDFHASPEIGIGELVWTNIPATA